MVVQGYVLMLWDCPTSLLGLGYLALVALLLMFPPHRGRYEELDNHGVPLELRRSCLPGILQNGAYHKSTLSNLYMKRHEMGGHAGRVLCTLPCSAYSIFAMHTLKRHIS